MSSPVTENRGQPTTRRSDRARLPLHCGRAVRRAWRFRRLVHVARSVHASRSHHERHLVRPAEQRTRGCLGKRLAPGTFRIRGDGRCRLIPTTSLHPAHGRDCRRRLLPQTTRQARQQPPVPPRPRHLAEVVLQAANKPRAVPAFKRNKRVRPELTHPPLPAPAVSADADQETGNRCRPASRCRASDDESVSGAPALPVAAQSSG
jgi:hypothetical protein